MDEKEREKAEWDNLLGDALRSVVGYDDEGEPIIEGVCGPFGGATLNLDGWRVHELYTLVHRDANLPEGCCAGCHQLPPGWCRTCDHLRNKSKPTDGT